MWLAGFSYRKLCTITDYSTDVHKTITVHAGTGTDTDTEVFCNNHAEVFPDDLRFAQEDGTLIDFWIEEQGTDYVEVVLELPSASCIYLYYGNTLAGPASSFDNTFKVRDSAENGTPTRWIVSGSPPDMEVLYVTNPVKNGTKSVKVNVLDSAPEKVARLGAATDITKGRYRWFQYIPTEASGSEVGIELRASPGEGENRIVYLIFYGNGSEIKYNQNEILYNTGSTWQEASWELYEVRFNQSNYSVSLFRYQENSWILLKSGIGCSNWTGNLQDFTVRHFSGATWYAVFDDVHEFNENTSPLFSWGEEEQTSKEFTLIYNIQTQRDFTVEYHIKIENSFEFLYNIDFSRELTFLYNLKTEVEFETVYNVLTGLEMEFTIYYHVLEYVDFLLDIEIESNIDAECDTARVRVPDDQKTSIAHYDIAGEDWILEKLIDGDWIPQFTGRCREMRASAPPPALEFVLYDYTIFLTISYITAIHNLIEASLCLRGYGSSTQILNLDADSQNWEPSPDITLSDDQAIFFEGTGSLKVSSVSELQWIKRFMGQDWSTYGRVTFWLRSAYQDQEFTFKIVDVTGNYLKWNLTTYSEADQFALYVLDFSNSERSGEVDLAHVSYIEFDFGNGAFWIDDLCCEEGIQDQYGNFANGVLYNMNVDPTGVEYARVNITVEWDQERRLDAARDVRDLVSSLKNEKWEFYIDKQKIAHFCRKRDQSFTDIEVNEDHIISTDLTVRWF
ncbi:MAG: DUF2341 domain-containing protein [Theionarchaea archaeon]|nr:DUF2341 domain-containing protein [Theionarchaea archaeon]